MTETKTLAKADFEKRFLALMYKTDVPITAPNLAYHLDVTIEEAQDQLLELELNGTVQQQIDAQGNTFYLMPNRPSPGYLPARLNGDPGNAAGGAPPGFANPADAPAAPMYRSAPTKGKNVNGMVLNVLFPGVGSLVCGQMIGLAMLGLLLLGFSMFFVLGGFSKVAGLLPLAGAWIWSIIAGIGLMNEKEAPQR